jgi:hypothetical protein
MSTRVGARLRTARSSIEVMLAQSRFIFRSLELLQGAVGFSTA